MSNNSTVTLFNSYSSVFTGFGINLKLFNDDIIDTIGLSTKLTNFNFKYARVLIKLTDPGMASVNFSTYNDYDNFFSNESYSTDGSMSIPSTAAKFFFDLRTAGITIIPCFLVPQSWLALDNSNFLTGTVGISGFANLILSGMLWIRSLGTDVSMVEIFNEPNLSTNPNGYISTSDHLFLAQKIKQLITLRNITGTPIMLLGPGRSSVISENSSSESYTNAFFTDRDVLDIWSIHANESTTDIAIANAGTFQSRKLLLKGLTKNTAHFEAIHFILQRFVTSFSTIATKFTSIGTDYGNNASTTISFAKRTMENLCNILHLGYNSAFFSNLNYRSTDTRSLFNNSDILNPVGSLMTYLTNIIPFPTNIWTPEELNIQDETIKTMFLSSTGNKLVVMLCRPFTPDTLSGKLKLYIENPLWNTNYSTQNLILESYPVGIDLTNTTINSVFSQGRLILNLTQVPYGEIIIFIKSDIALLPPVIPPVIPPSGPPNPGDPILLQTILQVPVVYNSPQSTNYVNGSIYYDSQSHKLKVRINGSWIDGNLIDYL